MHRLDDKGTCDNLGEREFVLAGGVQNAVSRRMLMSRPDVASLHGHVACGIMTITESAGCGSSFNVDVDSALALTSIHADCSFVTL